MKNGDKPAFATDCVVFDTGDYSNTIEKGKKYDGLTKREYFAGLAMQGFLSGINGIYSSSAVVKDSIDIADKLLKQLEQ